MGKSFPYRSTPITQVRLIKYGMVGGEKIWRPSIQFLTTKKLCALFEITHNQFIILTNTAINLSLFSNKGEEAICFIYTYSYVTSRCFRVLGSEVLFRCISRINHLSRLLYGKYIRHKYLTVYYDVLSHNEVWLSPPHNFFFWLWRAAVWTVAYSGCAPPT